MGRKKEQPIIGYKAFDENWKCRGTQYKVGATKIHKGEIKLCSKGLHYVENPFDMLNYYPLIGSKFAEVEAFGSTDEKHEDSKRVARKLHIKAELNLESVIHAGFKFIYNSVTVNPDTQATSGYGAHSATSGVDNAIACAVGRKAKAKASLGCFIVIAEWHEGATFTDAYPLTVKSAKVDGKIVKADTWYKVVNGEFVETDDSND